MNDEPDDSVGYFSDPEDQINAEDTPLDASVPVELKEPERLDETEIAEIAIGIVEDKVFFITPDMPPDAITMCFLPIGLGGFAGYDVNKVGNVIEWMHKAGTHSVNGLPMFMSCKIIHEDDWAIIMDKTRKAFAAMQAAIKGS